MRLFGLKTCDTCRKAEKALRAGGYAPDIVDVRADGVAPQDMARFLDRFGDDLVNRRASSRLRQVVDRRARDPAALLAAHPTLMKRPVIEHDGQLHLGWTAEVQRALLG